MGFSAELCRVWSMDCKVRWYAEKLLDAKVCWQTPFLASASFCRKLPPHHVLVCWTDLPSSTSGDRLTVARTDTYQKQRQEKKCLTFEPSYQPLDQNPEANALPLPFQCNDFFSNAGARSIILEPAKLREETHIQRKSKQSCKATPTPLWRPWCYFACSYK